MTMRNMCASLVLLLLVIEWADAKWIGRRSLKTDFPNTFEEGLTTHLIASGIAGFCCSAASNPVDVLKVRLFPCLPFLSKLMM